MHRSIIPAAALTILALLLTSCGPQVIEGTQTVQPGQAQTVWIEAKRKGTATITVKSTNDVPIDCFLLTDQQHQIIQSRQATDVGKIRHLLQNETELTDHTTPVPAGKTHIYFEPRGDEAAEIAFKVVLE